jgi:integrase
MYKRTPIEKRLRLRGDVWSFWGHDYSGERYTASTHVHGVRNKASALEAARRIERQRSVPPPDPATHRAQGFTLEEALGLLLKHDKRVDAAPNTITYHVDRGRHLIRLIGAEALCAAFITDGIQMLNAYTDARLAEGAGRNTINHEHRVLRHALALAKKDNSYAGEPKALVVAGFEESADVYEPGDTWLELAEYIDALVAHTSSNPDRHRVDRRDDILVYVNMGLRRREILFVMPEHVDLRARIVSIKTKRRKKDEERKTGLKTRGARRELPLNDVMHALFQRRLRSARPGVPLFTDWGSGNRDLQANWQRARAWLLAEAKTSRRRAELDAELPHSLNFNDLRRTFCSQMKNAGVSLEDCAELLGHEDIAMVKLVYGQTAMATLRAAVAKLPAMTLPPQSLPTRTQKLSRRQRQRLRAEAKLREACPASESTDTVFDTHSMRSAGSDGAD